MSRGFIKPVNGNTRMRFVKPGYNADDMNTPPNQVIFDSDDLGTLSILTRGQFHIPKEGTGSPAIYVKMVSWDYPFVPLCTFQSRTIFNGVPAFGWGNKINANNSNSTDYTSFSVRKDGIWVRQYFISRVIAYDIKYQAYRINAGA